MSEQPFEPFPIELLPKPLSRFITEASAAKTCDPSFVALPLLTAAGAAIGNTRRIALRRDWVEPPILWTAIVGTPGSRKSPAMDAIAAPIDRRQRALADAFRARLAEHESELADWKAKDKAERGTPPPAPTPMEHVYVDDATVEALAVRLADSPRGVMVRKDELSGWLLGMNQYKSGGGADVSHYLTMFGGRLLKVDRKTGDNRTIIVPRASVSITGGIQPGILRKLLAGEHFDNGLASRFLFAFPPKRKNGWTDAEISDASGRALDAMFDHLFALQPYSGSDDFQPSILKLSDRAQPIFAEFVDQHAGEQFALADDDLEAAYSKIEAYAARLGLILHCVRQAIGDDVDPWHVDELSIGVGIELAKWFAGETKRVYAMLRGDAEDDEADALIALIERHGGSITPRQLTRSIRRYPTTASAKQALQELVDDGIGEWKQALGAAGGRPSLTFFLRADTADADETPDFDSANWGFVNVGTSAGGEK